MIGKKQVKKFKINMDFNKKLLGIPSPIEWYDIKAKFKQIIRKILYLGIIQQLITLIIAGYMFLVFKTSKKKYINFDIATKEIIEKKPIICLFWHNRLMMIPFIAKKINQDFPDYKFMTLASKHGDGRIVGRVMEVFGFKSILGSTKSGRKSSRGIGIDAIKQIFFGLKEGNAIGITPDGPRGPNQKINGDVVNIARISGAKILTISYATKNYIQLNSWDKFKIPLPFSKLVFICDNRFYDIDKNSTKEQLEVTKNEVEESLNKVQDEADQLVDNF